MNTLRRLLDNPLLYMRRAADLRYLQFKAWHWRAELEARRGLARLRHYHATGEGEFGTDRTALLSRILNYAARHVPYYRGQFSRVGLDPNTLKNFAALPLLDKATIRRHASDIVSDELVHMPHGVLNTGGSTGEPLEFVTSGVTDAVHQEFLFRSMGWTPGDLIVALDGTQIPESRRRRGLYWVHKNRNDLPYGRVALSSLYLGEETITRYVEHLIELQPQFVRGYPSFAADLASYLQRSGLGEKLRLKGVELTSENVYPDQLERIRQAFRAPVHLQYGHSEGCVFGYTLRDSSLYFCSPFYGLTEVINARGEHAVPGESGEIVVTGFGNLAMPLIRYRTGDVAVYAGDERGVVRLSELLGRTQDFVYSTGGRRVALTALIFGCHYHAFANIKKWQLVQDSPGVVTVRVIRDRDFSEADEREVRDSFQRIAQIETVFEYVEAIPLTPRGKSQMIVQRLQAS